MRASQPVCMERNFRKVKLLPYSPRRSCRKKIGPLDDSLIANAIAANTGDKNKSAVALKARSMVLFKKSANLFDSCLRERSGYRAMFAEWSVPLWLYSSGKKWKDIKM